MRGSNCGPSGPKVRWVWVINGCWSWIMHSQLIFPCTSSDNSGKLYLTWIGHMRVENTVHWQNCFISNKCGFNYTEWPTLADVSCTCVLGYQVRYIRAFRKILFPFWDDEGRRRMGLGGLDGHTLFGDMLPNPIYCTFGTWRAEVIVVSRCSRNNWFGVG